MTDLRVLTPAERMYTYKQSQQISAQTSLIGHLRADMGSDGKQFYTGWENFDPRRNTPEFRQEFESLIHSLRSKGGILSDLKTLGRYCVEHPDGSFQNDRHEYGARIDSDQYAYLLRLNPMKGSYNLYCFCYEKRWLDYHIEQAEKGIRFITPDYKERFRISDGEKIRVTSGDGQFDDFTCRYIDDYHVEVGWNLYHICEFAERMEKNKNTVIPLRSSLPDRCYVYLMATGELGIVEKGLAGYSPTYITPAAGGGKELAAEMNKENGVTPAQAAAMSAGSMFGWDCPAADPKNYDENGNLNNPKKNKDISR